VVTWPLTGLHRSTTPALYGVLEGKHRSESTRLKKVVSFNLMQIRCTKEVYGVGGRERYPNAKCRNGIKTAS
jgi:hypothetical protein